MNNYLNNSDFQLFTDLKKHRPREGKDSLENFVTSAFCWILRNNKRFSNFFLSKLEVNNVEKGEWNTQTNFGGVFPDMTYIYAEKKKILVFEHKVWTNLHENQLGNYKEYVKNKYGDDNYKIILITANSYQHTQEADIYLCWTDIYKYIEGFEEKDFALKCFQNLLNNEGLGLQPPITQASIIHYFDVRDFDKNLSSLLGRLYHRLRQIPAIQLIEEYLTFELNKKWGRIGFGNWNENDIQNNWFPSIFIGFILEEKDKEEHWIKPLLNNSPDFVFMLCFRPNLHNIYPNNEYYNFFIDEMKKEFENKNEWNLYNHLEDKEAEEHNHFHPFYIRKPMLELFRGTTTSDEQDKAIDNAIDEVLPLIWKSENFIKMREELKNKNLNT